MNSSEYDKGYKEGMSAKEMYSPLMMNSKSVDYRKGFIEGYILTNAARFSATYAASTAGGMAAKYGLPSDALAEEFDDDPDLWDSYIRAYNEPMDY